MKIKIKYYLPGDEQDRCRSVEVEGSDIAAIAKTFHKEHSDANGRVFTYENKVYMIDDEDGELITEAMLNRTKPIREVRSDPTESSERLDANESTIEMPDRVWTVLGEADNRVCIEDAAIGETALRWTVRHGAKKGDGALFYLLNPVSSFVAFGILKRDAVMESLQVRARRASKKEHFWTTIGDIQMLHHLTRTELMERVREFTWVKMPINSYLIPDDVLSQISKLICVREAEGSDRFEEGSRVEYLVKGATSPVEGIVERIDDDKQIAMVSRDGNGALDSVSYGAVRAILWDPDEEDDDEIQVGDLVEFSVKGVEETQEGEIQSLNDEKQMASIKSGETTRDVSYDDIVAILEGEE